eukprot:105647_1
MGNQLRNSTKNNDTFIIEFNKKNLMTDPSDVPLCSKRLIFISLVGLFQTYKKCPPHMLHSSILVMPLKRKWIYSSKYEEQMQSVSSGLIGRDDAQSSEFYQLLKYKDSQGLVFWAKDEYKSSSNDTLTHPFWQLVSYKLSCLQDPITSKPYNPLPFEIDYWLSNQDDVCSVSNILTELSFMSLKYESMKHILNASNPQSFRVITAYNNDLFINDCCRNYAFMRMERLEDDSDAQSGDEWWVSAEYY